MSDLMTSRFPTMRDAGMPLPERINAAIDRIAHGNGHMRVPVEATDPDIVLGDCRVELESQAAQIAALKTVMIAAAEEIAAHWEAHCDAEGYGPQNLLRRLEEGIPSEYGYTAGAFAALTSERDALRADAERLRIRGAAYEAAYGIAYQATYQSHNGHWDSTMQGGIGCRECIRAREARENCDRALREGLEALAARASLNPTTTRSEP